MKKVGFAILTWNSVNCIKDCLEAIQKLDSLGLADCQVSVLDNGSADGTADYLRSLSSPKIRTAFCDRNIGTTKGRNLALLQLGACDYICFLDSDAYILDQDGFLSALSFLDTHPDVGLLGPTLVGEDGSIQSSARNIPFRREKFLKIMPFKGARKKAERMEHVSYDDSPDVFPVGYLMSACILMRQVVCKDIGLWDEKIFYAPEDVDFCVRAWERGYKVIYYRPWLVMHEWQRISRKKFFSKHNLSHIKGLMYFYRKHKHLKTLRAQIREEYDSACGTGNGAGGGPAESGPERAE
ncbi:MAG: glycosyltransferase [Clostridia bacterium]|nr:glycosyltransferase [Clostridia bacterium]